MKIQTIGPLFTGLDLQAGLDPKSEMYQPVLAALPPDSDEIEVPNRRTSDDPDFGNLDRDDYNLRLLVWRPGPVDGGPSVEFHLYPNGVCIVRSQFEVEHTTDAAQLQKQVQAITRDAVDTHAGGLNQILSRLATELPSNLTDTSALRESVSAEDFGWIARAVILPESATGEPGMTEFVEEWLRETVCPEDAQRILAGESDRSVSWVNYLFVGTSDAEVNDTMACVRLAQFFFAAQYSLNLATQQTITEASVTRNVREANEILSAAREKMQFLNIQFGIQKSFLRRSRKRTLENLLEGWEFEELVENGHRMVEASTAKIDQITTRRRERSSFVTDLILAGIALLTVIELSLYLTEYSRMVMSQPVLGYNDDGLSWILTRVANVDTDTVLVGGTLSIIILVLIYAYWKLRR